MYVGVENIWIEMDRNVYEQKHTVSKKQYVDKK